MILMCWVMGQVTLIFAQISCLPLQKESRTSVADPDRLRIPPSPWYCSGGAWGRFILEERKSGPPVKFISNNRSMCSTLNFCLKCGTPRLCIRQLCGLPVPYSVGLTAPETLQLLFFFFALSASDLSLHLFLSFPGWRDFLSSYSLQGWLLPPELPDFGGSVLLTAMMSPKMFSQDSLRRMGERITPK